MEGALIPGMRLRESTLAEELGISRNTLREAFRALENERLITHFANRGAQVAMPSRESIVDLYRVRRLIEVVPLQSASLEHPAAGAMRQAIEEALDAQAAADWKSVGTADLNFHRAVVSLAESPRISEFYEMLAGELRLAFWLVDDPAVFHSEYVGLNQQILDCYLEGDSTAAAARLQEYLDLSEHTVLAAHARAHGS